MRTNWKEKYNAEVYRHAITTSVKDSLAKERDLIAADRDGMAKRLQEHSNVIVELDRIRIAAEAQLKNAEAEIAALKDAIARLDGRSQAYREVVRDMLDRAAR